MHFTKRPFTILKKHHAEAARNQIETFMRKRQLVRVGLPDREVCQFSLFSSFSGDLQKLTAEIEGSNMTCWPDARGQADGRFTGTARQI